MGHYFGASRNDYSPSIDYIINCSEVQLLAYGRASRVKSREQDCEYCTDLLFVSCLCAYPARWDE